jgi:orotidine-5'-phosphate decarboxylase
VKQFTARERLIVALDVSTVEEARRLVRTLGDSVVFYKVGLEVLFDSGLDLVRELAGEGKRVFLDVKLLDIGNTVERAVANIGRLGVDFVTVHAQDTKTLRAASAGRGTSAMKLLGVTVLTNLGQADLAESGIGLFPSELVLVRAKLAREAGLDGIVASGQEAGRIRAAVGPGMLIVTPGIRLPEAAKDDQERITTPQQAIASGADYIVVGRPITRAPEPKKVAEEYVHHIEVGAVATARAGFRG